MGNLYVQAKLDTSNPTGNSYVQDGTTVSAWATSRFLVNPSGYQQPPPGAADATGVTVGGNVTLAVANNSINYWVQVQLPAPNGEQDWFLYTQNAGNGNSSDPLVCVMPTPSNLSPGATEGVVRIGTWDMTAGAASWSFPFQGRSYGHLQVKGWISITNGSIQVTFNSDNTAGHYGYVALQGIAGSSPSVSYDNSSLNGFGTLLGVSGQKNLLDSTILMNQNDVTTMQYVLGEVDLTPNNNNTRLNVGNIVWKPSPLAWPSSIQLASGIGTITGYLQVYGWL